MLATELKYILVFPSQVAVISAWLSHTSACRRAELRSPDRIQMQQFAFGSSGVPRRYRRLARNIRTNTRYCLLPIARTKAKIYCLARSKRAQKSGIKYGITRVYAASRPASDDVMCCRLTVDVRNPLLGLFSMIFFSRIVPNNCCFYGRWFRKHSWFMHTLICSLFDAIPTT